MIFRLIATYVFLTIFCCSASEAPLYRMADTAVLRARLAEHGFGYFQEKTHLAEKLGGSEKYALGVAVAVECAFDDYQAYLAETSAQQLTRLAMRTMSMRKDALLEALLLPEHQAALDELAASDLYKGNS